MDRQNDALEAEIEDHGGLPRAQEPPSERPGMGSELLIAIASTFTSDLLRRPLRFWMQTLELRTRIEGAPYAQVMQELLNPQSLLSQNRSGFNILLVRPEDWIRDRLGRGVKDNLKHLHTVAHEFVGAVEALHERTRIPLLVFFGPASSSLSAEYSHAVEEAHCLAATRLQRLKNVHFWSHPDLVRLYPVEEYEDARSDRIGHIPYTNGYFVALATLLARRVAALSKPPCKVIAVDCDNTLWQGICGEDGPMGVQLTDAHLDLQRLLVRQHDAGVLLCLCSKNNPGDVEAVFRSRPEMLLRDEHLVASRVSWETKSSSLQSLSEELGLSLDSFILIDDSAMECAEVKASCPSVLTLQFPQTHGEVARFLESVWAFDRIGVTDDAKRRTAQYRENRARRAAFQQTSDFDRFLASLELTVEVSPLQLHQLPRVAELVQRTNQFNVTTVRRLSSEIQALWESGALRVLVASVRDRFGDYGLVGAVLFRCAPACIDVDTFVLSCRALGRGAEHRIVNELARIARQEGLPEVVLTYRPTPRNAPAGQFLSSSFGQFSRAVRSEGETVPEQVFAVPVEYAEQLRPGQQDLEQLGTKAARTVTAQGPAPAASILWNETAYRLNRVADIEREISRAGRSTRTGRSEYVEPGTPVETALVKIFIEVLGTERAGACDSFFDLGGDSLQAVQVIARVESDLGLELPLHRFFEGPTARQAAAVLARASQAGPPIQHVESAHPAPLSWAQQRLWFIHHVEGASVAYHIPLAIRFRGALDRAALQSALDGLLVRHASLRTVFINVGTQPAQQVMPPEPFRLHVIDLSLYEPQQREMEVGRQAQEALAEPFDLATGPLIRGQLLQLTRDESVLVLTMHHIISDGWSVGVLIRELGALYRAHHDGRPDSLAPLSVQYTDYAQWQREWLSGAVLQAQLAYWERHLQGAPPILEIPLDRPRPAAQSYRGASVDLSLGSGLTAALKDLSRRLDLTLAMTLYSAWLIVLSKLSRHDDIVIGIPVANRRRPELEGLVGFFVNTLAVRVQLDDDLRVTDLLQRVKESMLGAYAHQDVPFEKVVEALHPVRSLRHAPVFQVMFVLQNTPRSALQLPRITLLEQQVPLATAQFDLTLSLQESPGGLVGFINYASDLFDELTIRRWSGFFSKVLTQILADVRLKLGDVTLMDETQRSRVIEVFNATRASYPDERSLQELFEDQARRTPTALAVTYQGHSLTYARLNAKANQLARYLVAHGMQSGEYVAVVMPRSVQMLIAQLAVLKGGAVYVPVDPEAPPERRSFLIRDCQARRVLIDSSQSTEVRVHGMPAIDYAAAAHSVAEQPTSNLRVQTDSRAAAYVMYTSGSTGLPKGVVVPHRGVSRLVINNGYAQIEPGDCIAHSSNPAFDASTFEIWAALLNGARVLIVPQSVVLDDQQFKELLGREQVSVLWMTVGLFAQYKVILGDIFAQLRFLLIGGDVIEPSAVRWVLRNCPPRHFLAAYGPTECTTFSTTYPLESTDVVAAAIPIGRPIANAQVYILDRSRRPAPIGAVGELYIAGAGVANGYLGRPDLTAERFLADTFSADPGARMYRTGDLGRWRADGAIEFLGRNDQQVKIRGFRIELGEIEAQLLRHSRVKEAVVLARQDIPGEKRLVAYVIPTEIGARAALDVETLRAHLKTSLPEYMVPGAFVMLSHFPLNRSGKLDRRALPLPELAAYATRAYEAPQGEVEEALAGIWQGLLGVERVGRQDNFFELGGHSLLVVQMLERLRRIGLSAAVHRVFESPTLAELAGALSSRTPEELDVPPNLIPPQCEAITPQMLPLVDLEPQHIERIVRTVPGGAANIQDIYPLAPLQEGILFHHLLGTQGGDTYVVPILLSVASRQHLQDLIAALQALIDRHDVLRTAVLWEHLPRPVQVVYRHATLPVEHLALDRDRSPLEQAMEWMRPEKQHLDLRQAPLMRVQIAADPLGPKWYVLLQLHHIVGDNTSQEIELSEIVAHLEGRAQQLPPPVPYRSHVAQALAYARNHDSEAFFRRKLGDIDEPTAPFAVLDVHGSSSPPEEACQTLEKELEISIRAQARRLGVSAATLFHAAWALVVAHTSSRESVVFGSVLLGRLQGSAGAQRILGLFINTLPLRLDLQTITARELVEQTQRELIELLSHEQASLAVAQRCSGIVGSAPLFTALLNYRHGVPNPLEGRAKTSGLEVLARQDLTNYPITMSVDDLGEGFTLTAQTDQRIDPAQMIGYLRTALQSLTQALASASHTPVLALSILPESERHQLLESFNATLRAYPQEQLIHELFEDQASRTPDAVALSFSGQALTYSQLNSRSNQLAWYLRETGIGPDQRVGICVERSFEMVIGLLGILKAGGAYVPLDPTYPAERLRYMLSDAAPGIVLTQEHLLETLSKSDARLVALDHAWSEIASSPAENLPSTSLGLNSGHLAYVIYTSGSTGLPKGAMNEHRGVVNRLQWMQHAYELSCDDRVLQKTPFSFDVSVWEFFWTLTSGAQLILARPGGHRDPRYLCSLIEQAGVTRLHFVPSMLKSFLEQHRSGECVTLRHVVCSGEELPAALQAQFVQHLPQARLSNLYGPTEAAVDVTAWECDPQDRSSRVPIGRPISNTQIYLLSRQNQTVPRGVAGEIHIGGVGVGRGYLNRPDLTAARFVSDPFNPQPGARMYRTGDLGRWRRDGSIEYLGRNDHQVKIRGFRIELGEIEAHLERHPHIREAVVIAREHAPGDRRLVAYLLPRESAAGEEVSADRLRAYLKQLLPEHMVPAAFVVLEQFPLTPSGKLDRRALPAPELEAHASRRYEAPQGEIEEILASIWQSLLRLERVGRNDNFFELGGHSLLIMQMMERLRNAGLSAEVGRVFESPTLTDLANVLKNEVQSKHDVPPSLIPVGCQRITPQLLPLIELNEEHLDTIVKSVPGGAANVQDIYPLAPLQEGILFHHLLAEKRADPYVRSILLSLASQDELQRLITALQLVVDRHDVLRTAVLWEQLAQPVQVVYRRAVLPVEEVALDRNRDPIEQLMERMQPQKLWLDLRHAPLVRIQAARDPGSPAWYALLQTHHLVCDHSSLQLMLAEVGDCLAGGPQEQSPSLPYRDHVFHALSAARMRDSESFFRRTLGDVDEPTAPFGRLDVYGDPTRIGRAREALDPAFTLRVRSQARHLGVSAATLFHAAWALVISRTSGRDDVVFGTVLLGRLQGTPAQQRALGMFINTLPLRVRLRAATARELVERTQQGLIGLVRHEQASLALAQRCSAMGGTAPLFTALLNYRHGAMNFESQLPGVSVLAGQGGTNYPVALSVDDLSEQFMLEMETDRHIDPKRMLVYLCTAIRSLVDALESAPDTPAVSLEVLPWHEFHQVIRSFNATRTAYPREKLVHELFEERAGAAPDAVAVVYEGQSLTYTGLNRKANQLAHYLRGREVGPDQVVGICVERSLEMVVGLIGILKAGGAYVPLDPSYPVDRLQYMLGDAAPRVLLTQRHLRERLPQTDAEIIELDGQWSEIARHPAGNLEASTLGLRSDHLAYVIYTSGSTGKPKGAMNEHRGVVNRLQWMQDAYRLGSEDRVLQKTPFSFDVSVWEFFWTLMSGARLIVARPEGHREPTYLRQLIEQEGVSTLHFVPSMLQSFLDQHRPGQCSSVRHVICSGEALSAALQQTCFECLPHAQLSNLYGPTEAAVDVTAWECRAQDDIAQVPIGRPIANIQMYVLDAHGQPVPLGVAGELYIGGVGVARGYLNRPELTAERFIKDPFSGEPQGRLYRTGDLGRWRPDGNIEYLGRNDHQVKIRGFRIELGEIEAQLLRHPQVNEAVVLAREDVPGEKRLVAYVVCGKPCAASEAVTVEILRAHLKPVLPDYMIPSAFLMLETLPLSANGKIDRRALPAPELGAYGSREYEAPQGEVEEALAQIWQRLLRVERIGRQDNFFHLGGHSLLATRVMTHVSQLLDVDLPVRVVFERPTLQGMSDYIISEVMTDMPEVMTEVSMETI